MAWQANGTAPPSIASALIERGASDALVNQKSIPAQLYFAGADTVCSQLNTTVSSSQRICAQSLAVITTFVLAMVLNPETQRKAQEEIDTVLGGTRLPTFEDESLLPYVGAVVKEVLRWHPVAPLGTVTQGLSQLSTY